MLSVEDAIESITGRIYENVDDLHEFHTGWVSDVCDDLESSLAALAEEEGTEGLPKSVIAAFVEAWAEDLRDERYPEFGTEPIYYHDIYRIFENNAEDCDDAFFAYGNALGDFDSLTSALAASAACFVDQWKYQAAEEVACVLEGLKNWL